MNKTRQELESQFGFEYIDWLNHKKENHRDYLIAKGEDVIDEESEDEDES